MSKVLDSIDAKLREWVAKQPMFFVATAPLAGEGHVNVSPKGGDSFRVLGDHSVAYQDYTGSGVETIAHLRENGRIVVMFCAFEGAPKILRFHGLGRVVTRGDEGWGDLVGRFPEAPGMRAIIHIDVHRISDSCGFSVPLFDYRGDRDQLDRWAESRGAEGLVDYRRERNATSIDGLPGFDGAPAGPKR